LYCCVVMLQAAGLLALGGPELRANKLLWIGRDMYRATWRSCVDVKSSGKHLLDLHASRNHCN